MTVTPFQRLFTILTKPLVFGLYVLLLVVSILYFDKPIAYYFHSLKLDVQFPWLNWLTKLGLGAPYIGLLLLIALFFRYIYRNRRYEYRTWFIWLNVVLASSICLLLKTLLGRARPILLFQENLYGFYGFKTSSYFWSFPSGHSTAIMALTFALSIVFTQFGSIWILLGLLIASSRIFLTYHYLSDVLAAFYLTLLSTGLLFLRYND